MIRRRHAPFSALMIVAMLATGVAAPQSTAAVEHVSEVAPTDAKADRDGDGLFDDLEARLEELADETAVDVIVRLRARPTPARVAELGRSVGPLGRTRTLSIVDGFAANLTRRQVEALARHPYVMSVEEDSVVYATNDSGQNSFGAAAARLEAGVDGDGDGNPAVYSAADLVAAVIDTGIDAKHLDLNGGKVLAFRDFVSTTGGVMTAPYDDHGHGTHVAATIAGDGEGRSDRRYRGVAPGAALVGVKVLNANGAGSSSNVTDAIGWVVANKATYGINVINLSLGSAGCSSGTDATSVAVNQAEAAGLVVVASAGNSGPGTCTIGTPAAAAGAITVASMADPTERGFALARSSSRGPTLDGRIKPDVSAPGVNVTSARSGTTTGYIAYSGTSMAAPFTAGVVLLMLAVSPSLTPAQVRNAIASSAVDWGLGGDGKTARSRGADNEYGHGRLDAYAAIRSAGAAINNPPVAPAHSLFEGTLSGTGATVNHVFNVTSLEFPIAATLIQPKISGGTASRPDFDIYLYNPAGTQVAKGDTQYRQDSLSHVPKVVGQYRLRVRSYRGNGGYFVDASYGATTAATPTPSPTPTPAPTAPTTVTAKPAGVAVLQGSYRKGNAASLAKNDGIYYVVDSTASGTRVAAWYGSFNNVARDLSSLSITYRGSNTVSATQTVSIYRWTDSSWVVLNSRTVGRTEIKIANLSPPGNPANYVSGSGASGEVRVRIRSVLNTSFRSRGEVMKIVYTRP